MSSFGASAPKQNCFRPSWFRGFRTEISCGLDLEQSRQLILYAARLEDVLSEIAQSEAWPTIKNKADGANPARKSDLRRLFRIQSMAEKAVEL